MSFVLIFLPCSSSYSCSCSYSNTCLVKHMSRGELEVRCMTRSQYGWLDLFHLIFHSLNVVTFNIYPRVFSFHFENSLRKKRNDVDVKFVLFYMYTQLNGNGRELNCKRYQCEIVKCILAETKPENVKSFHHRILDLFGNMCTNCDYLQYYRFRACGFMRRFKERRN